MNRRTFITSSSAALLASGCTVERGMKTKDKSYSKSSRKVTLKLATSWPAHFPIMGTVLERFAERVKIASNNTLIIKIYPKNTLIPALAVFDAASTGQIDAFHSGPYYWKGKNSAFSLFGGLPFGLIESELNAWMHYGDGLKLWRELYAEHNLYPFLGGNTSIQMGGWFRKPIESVQDLQGLKMRIPGLGGEVMAKLGVNPILLPAGEIFTALERGTIDATEWVGPALDKRMGFSKVAKYYYSGWHEPASTIELTFNKQSFEKLSNTHKAIIEVASAEMNAHMTYEFQAKNAKALQKLKAQGTELRTFNRPIIDAAKKALQEVLAELSSQNRDFKKVLTNYLEFSSVNTEWTKLGLQNYLEFRN